MNRQPLITLGLSPARWIRSLRPNEEMCGSCGAVCPRDEMIYVRTDTDGSDEAWSVYICAKHPERVLAADA